MTDEDKKVADALKHSWVYWLPTWAWPYAQLARWERPIGWQLLMWPCWWSFVLALLHEIAPRVPETGINVIGSGFASAVIAGLLICLLIAVPLLLFTAGSVLMRGAGCTYNDLVDTDIDNKVARTRSRPLPSGRATKTGAAVFLGLQLVLGLAVLLTLSKEHIFVFWLGIASLVTVLIYPFMKRITWWPQLFLGLAFSWGALMGWAVVFGSLSATPVLLYLGCICWVIGFDTIYAHQDKEDDALVGVKSTALLFGEKTRQAVSILYLAALLLFTAAYLQAVSPYKLAFVPAYLGLLTGAVQMFSQIQRMDIDDPDQCLRLFKSNNRFGMILFVGLLASLLLNSEILLAK